MKKYLIFILFLIFNLTSFSQKQKHKLYHLNRWNTDTVYLAKNKEYCYRAIYINENGDTITQDSIVLKPLAKAWLAQPNVQQAVRYIYYTDTLGYHNFVHPIEYFQERNQRKYKKKGHYPLSFKETTGAVYNDKEFYMHPPRTNQFSMLFYSIHPKVDLSTLTNKKEEKDFGLEIPLMGVFNWHSTITPMPDSLLFEKKVKVWKITTVSIGDIKEKDKQLGIYNSQLESLFTREFGFIKLHYTFENNIKMNFDLDELIQ